MGEKCRYYRQMETKIKMFWNRKRQRWEYFEKDSDNDDDTIGHRGTEMRIHRERKTADDTYSVISKENCDSKEEMR